jgi:hypothetical protein
MRRAAIPSPFSTLPASGGGDHGQDGPFASA